MSKKLLKELVQASYTKDVLDSKKVEQIAKLLSRHDLKEYIRAIKLSEKARTIHLVLPKTSVYNKNDFAHLFNGKKVVVEEDPSLLLGVKVIDNDSVYDMTLKGNLEAFAKEAVQ